MQQGIVVWNKEFLVLNLLYVHKKSNYLLFFLSFNLCG